MCTALMCCGAFSRFKTANPEGWDASFLSSLSTWWSIAELRRSAQLSAARVGSVELWACVPAIQSTPLRSHPRQTLAHQFNFGHDFYRAGAAHEESLLSSCLQRQRRLRIQTLCPHPCASPTFIPCCTSSSVVHSFSACLQVL